MQIPSEQQCAEREKRTGTPKRRPQAAESRVGNDTRPGSHRSHGGGRPRRGLKEFATNPSAVASPPPGSSDFTPAKVLVGNAQRRKEKEVGETGSPAVRILARPRPAETQLTRAEDEETALFLSRDIKFMTASARLIDDNLTFMDFCKEYLLDWSDKLHVVGIIGPQGVGKSTLLSMLAGNEPSDAYRQYVFRPGSREAVELGRYQTTKINIFVDRWRSIFLDCQSSSPSLFEDYVRQRKRDVNFSPDGYDLECLKLTMLMLNACDTVVICVDAFEQVYDCIKDLVEAERHYPSSASIATTEQLPPGKINIVVVHQHAAAEDFHPLLVRERMRKLESIFDGIERFEIRGGLNVGSLGIGRCTPTPCSLQANYVVVGDMRVEPYRTPRQTQEPHMMMEDAPTYAEVIGQLKIKIPHLPRRRPTPGVSELEWFNATRRAWNRIMSIDVGNLRGVSFPQSPERVVGRWRGERIGGRRERRQRGLVATDKKLPAVRTHPHSSSVHSHWRDTRDVSGGLAERGKKVASETPVKTNVQEEELGGSASGTSSSSLSPSRMWRNRRRRQDEDECDDSDYDEVVVSDR